MTISAEAQDNPSKKSPAGKKAYVLYAPLDLEQQVLGDAGRQIEAVAFALAKRVPAKKIGELMEIAARIQKFRIKG
ncbi:hypothetical protein [Paracoccus onubensis]|uniref:Uncharacterized protein n=1 Tax=Paracoccus onubensis TaxID=1675788 RepID=A0A418SXR3_9RHOB|nr:hypothetical protein [Paracoccus onubensis]RJE85754.1 hypothetical protein D3P04_08300 [Paracoccus onubensis]